MSAVMIREDLELCVKPQCKIGESSPSCCCVSRWERHEGIPDQGFITSADLRSIVPAKTSRLGHIEVSDAICKACGKKVGPEATNEVFDEHLKEGGSHESILQAHRLSNVNDRGTRGISLEGDILHCPYPRSSLQGSSLSRLSSAVAPASREGPSRVC